MRLLSMLLALVPLAAGVPAQGGSQESGVLVAETLALPFGQNEATLLDRRADVSIVDLPLRDALGILREYAGARLVYSPSILPSEKLVSCACEGVTIREALNQILSGTGFYWQEVRGNVLIEPRPAYTPSIDIPAPRPRDVTAAHSAVEARVRGTRAERVQRIGTIAGRVINASTGGPVDQAQISVVGQGLGSLSRGDGQFLIINVPDGTHELRVERIGFAPATQQVTVSAGQTTVVTVRLAPQAVALDELVVTGLPGAARRREVGTVMTQIDMDELTNRGVPSVESALQGAGAGISVMQTQGQVGGGGNITLRGINSVSQGNEPLIYIDGIRMSTERIPVGRAFDGRNTRTSGFTFSDLNMADIESIEVIKGAAATALYGTEASAGVIQIFTKKGVAGSPQFSFSVDQGANFWPTLPEHIQSHPTSLDIDVARNTGHVQRYSGSVRGGSEGIQYFVSGSLSDETGIVRKQGSQNWTTTANLTLNLAQGLDLNINNSYTQRETQTVADGNNRYGYLLNVLRVGRGYLPGDRDHEWVLEQEYNTDVSQYVGGAKFSYVHSSLRHELTVGVHQARAENTGLQPFGWVLQPQGTIRNDQWTNTQQSVEYVGTWETRLASSLTSRLSWGGQLYDEETVETAAIGEGFPGPGEHTVSSAANRTGEESRIREQNAGFFLQATLAHSDRLFITGAGRFDGSSTFGGDYGLEFYPKFSISYVLSDSDNWPEWWSSMRLRGALGSAGRAPGAFDAERTWNPISARGGTQPGVLPGNLGNPELGPEKTREFEFGFDSEMYGGRLGLSVTYFDALTTDALFSVLPTPSAGFTSSQLQNVGELSNTGWEVEASLGLMRTEALNWDVGVTATKTTNEVTDIGGSAPFSTGRDQQIREGFAPPSYFGRRLTNPNELADPVFEDDAFLGQTFPDFIVNLNTDVVFGPVTFSALGEFNRGGHLINAFGWLNSIRDAWPECDEARSLDDAGQLGTVTARQRARCLNRFNAADQFVESSDFFKLRTVSLTYRVPERMLPGGIGSATLSVAGNNLWKVTDYTGLDPEVHQGGANNMFREEYYSMPPARRLVTRLSFTF